MIRKTLLAALTAAAAGARPAHVDAAAPTVILVHGDLADGSSWDKVIAFAFAALAGLATIASPCILPMLPWLPTFSNGL